MFVTAFRHPSLRHSRCGVHFTEEGGDSPSRSFQPAFVGRICLDTDSTTPISANWIDSAVPP